MRNNTDNTDIIRTYDMNHHNVTYDSAILFVNGIQLTDTTQKIPKWSLVTVSILIDNPTDLTFGNMYTELSINSIVMRSGNLNLLADSSFRSNLTWTASVEGPLSLRVDTTVVDYSDNSTDDIVITLSKFVHVAETSVSSKESGSWIALVAVFVILSISSYIIYSGIEDESDSSESDKDIEEDKLNNINTIPVNYGIEISNTISFIAIPPFVVALYSLLIFAVALKWLPAIGVGESGDLSSKISHLILPSFAVGLGWVGYLARLVRSSMLEVLKENHVRTARAYGISERNIILHYVLRIAILPTITLLGTGIGILFSSSVFAEIVFSRPGIGKLIYESVINRNYPVVMGAVLVTSTLFVITTTLSDIENAILDPRIINK